MLWLALALTVVALPYACFVVAIGKHNGEVD